MLKGRDLLNAVSRIDNKYIEEAENYGYEDVLLGKTKKQRNNGLLSAVLVMIFVMVIAAVCLSVKVDDTTNKTQNDPDPKGVMGSKHEEKDDTNDNSEPEPDKDSQSDVISVGDQIIFGSYEQDNDTTDGKEVIEWIVLAKESDRMLVISKYGLDAKAYNDESRIKTWEDSTIRKWLNDDFFNEAFSYIERERIQNTKVIAEDNPQYGTKAGNDTEDKIFLLSISEAEKYLSFKEDRVCAVSEYAKANGNYTDQGFPEIDGKMVWMSWLRSPGARFGDFASTTYEGFISYGGGIGGEWLAIRPAMWIAEEK